MKRLANIFVLTRREQQLILFVVLAFVVGSLTKRYRDAHPRTPAEQRSAVSTTETPTPPPKSLPTEAEE